jgi:WhiB family redox-sensing transcriptional regulator
LTEGYDRLHNNRRSEQRFNVDFNARTLYTRLLPEWAPLAACAGKDSNIWFPESDRASATEAVQKARRICLLCPVRKECLEWAFENVHSTVEGVYGGTTGEEREQALKEGPGYIERLLSEEKTEAMA